MANFRHNLRGYTKREVAHRFLVLTFLKQVHVSVVFFLSYANALKLDRSKILLFGREIKTFAYFTKTIVKGENIGKGENTGDQHFLLFPHCFLPYKS